MAVARSGSVTVIQSSADSGSQSITAPSGASIMVVTAVGFNSVDKINAASVTYGGTSLTLKSNNQGTGNTAGDQVGVFYLTSPTSGAATLAWNWGGTTAWGDGGQIFVAFYTGSDTTTPWGTVSTLSTASTNTDGQTLTTGSLTIASGDMVLAACYNFTGRQTESHTWTTVTQAAGGTFNASWAFYAEGSPAAGTSTVSYHDTSTLGTGANGQFFNSLSALVLKATSGTTVTAPAGVITLGAVAPAINFDDAQTAPAGLITLGAVAPSITEGTVVSPPAGLITLGAVSPVIRADDIQTAPAGVLTLSAVAPTISISGTGAFNTLYDVGRGIMDSQRSIVRTASGRIYIFAAEDRPLTVQTSPDTSEETSPFLRAYRADQSSGIPTTFTEQDTAHRPKTGSNTVSFCVPDVRLDSSGVVHMIYQKWVSSTTSDLIYNTFNTATDTWGTAESITTAINTLDGTWKRSFYAAALTLDTSDKPQVVYGIGTSVAYKTRASGSWSSATTIHSATETAPTHFNAVSNTAGDIFVVWVSAPLGATSDIRFTQRISGTWLAAPETVISGAQTASNLDQTPGIALNNSGNPVALYITNSAEVMAVKTRSGGTWGAADSSGVDTHAPGIYMVRDDIYLGEGHSIGTTPDIQSAWVSKLSGGAWSAEHIPTQDTTTKDGSASMRYESWHTDPWPSYIDVAYMDEDIDDTSSTNHFAKVFYAALAPAAVYVTAPPGQITLSSVAPAITIGSGGSFIESLIARGLIPGLNWRTRLTRN